jgi:hypothetical protein
VETFTQAQNIPEYPHRPAAHLKRPTAINIKGKISHCETELRAGQRKAARGYVGLTVEERPLFVGTAETSLLFEDFLTFRRGLWGEGPAIVTQT